jgi:flagellar hook-associated protein 3 FlgL
MQVISTLAMNTLLSGRMNAVEAQIQQLEKQVSSGLKTDTYNDLGAQAAIDIALHDEGRSIETYQTNNQLIATRMTAMDQAMNAINDAGQTIQDQAFALTDSDTQRTALVNGAKSALATVLNALQVSVGGRAVFAGDQTDTSPLRSTIAADLGASITSALSSAPADKAAAVTGAAQALFADPANFYQGGAHINAVAIDKNLRVDYGIEGDNAAFRDVLQGLATIAVTPKPGTDLSAADYGTIINDAAATIAHGLGQLRALIASNGSNQALVESTNAQHAATLTMVQSQINTIEQADIPTAATQLSLLRTQLQATYALTSQIGQLSLVDYLK